MALRNIRLDKDEILRKKSKKIDNITDNIQQLIDDMIETMYEADGVGLAAPQVGILKRVVVIDVGDGPIVLINPEIINSSGEQIDSEGCLSVPNVTGEVKRPNKVTVRAMDREGQTIELTGKGLLARAFCHEIDHLNGILFIDKIIK